MQGQGCALTTINAYRTCKASDASTSSSISAREKRSLLHANHRFATNPRKAFLHDIIQFVREQTKKGNKVILCMDANTPWDHTDIWQLKLATGLNDLMEFANPDTFPPPATYDRGDDEKGNIDIALGCDLIAEALLTAGFYGFYSTNWSDRRLGELRFDTHVLLGPPIHSSKQKKRDLNLLYRLHTDKYKQRLHDLHSTSKTVERLITIEQKLNSSKDFQTGVLEAQHLMARASEYMTLSKQVTVPRVPTSNPWSTTLGRTGIELRTATRNYNDSLTSDIPENSENLLDKLTVAKRSHASSTRNTPSLRQKRLLAMADEVAQQRKCEPSSAIRQIYNAEESKLAHKKHKFILKGVHPGRIKTVVVPFFPHSQKKQSGEK